MNLFVFTKAWLMHINAWILLILPCIAKHISAPQNTLTHVHTHTHWMYPTKKEEKSQPIIIKYLWHIVNGFVKKIASY